MSLFRWLKHLFKPKTDAGLAPLAEFPPKDMPYKPEKAPLPLYLCHAAEALARLSQLIYPHDHCTHADYKSENEFAADMADKQKRLKTVGFQSFSYAYSGESRILSIVVQKKRDVFICFRGTVINNPLNWGSDLQAFTDPEEGLGEVHRGFQKALDSIWPRLLEILAPLKQGRRWWLTGHSLGGALALLASARLERLAAADHGCPVIAGVYTFGAPRVGDTRFKQAVDSLNLSPRIFAFANADDVITVVPPCVKPFFSYCDAGQIALFSAGGQLIFLPALSEFKTFRCFLGGYFRKQLAASFNLEKLKHDWNTYKRYFSRAFAEIRSLKDTPEKELNAWERIQRFFSRETPESTSSNPDEENENSVQVRKNFSQLMIDLFTELFLEMNPFVVSTHDIRTYLQNLQNNRDVAPELSPDVQESRPDNNNGRRKTR